MSRPRRDSFVLLTSKEKGKVGLFRCDATPLRNRTDNVKGKHCRRLSLPQEICLSLFTIPPLILAEQMTILELPLFRAIPREELLRCQWTSKQKQDLSPHIVASIAHFNQISYWLVREILSVSDLKGRADLLMHTIRLASKLLELRNINGLKAVISALTSQPIYRLNNTWALVSKRDQTTFSRLCDLLSDDDNKINLRRYMDEVTGQCIPFLGMYLTDLLYIDAALKRKDDFGCSSKEGIADLIASMQTSEYEDLFEDSAVLSYIKSCQYIDEMQTFEENEHYRMSLSLEPTESNFCPGRAMTYGSQSSSSCPRVCMLSPAVAHPEERAESRRRRMARSLSSSGVEDHSNLFSLSVIAPEVSSGPRHLIDGSLMTAGMSTSSAACSVSSSDSSNAGDLSSISDDLAGIAARVQCDSSDDDNEILLPSAEGDDQGEESGRSSRSRRPLSRQSTSDLLPEAGASSVFSGVVQYRKASVSKASSTDSTSPTAPTSASFSSSSSSMPSTFTRSSSSFRGIGSGWARWKTAIARVSDDQFALIPPPAKGLRRRGSLRTTMSQPVPLFVADLSRSDVVISLGKNKTFKVLSGEDKVVFVKTASDEERSDWVELLTDIQTKCRLSKNRISGPLITFEDEDFCDAR